MMSVKFWKHVLVACAVAALAGCSGAEGPMGPEGPAGQNGQDGAQGEKGEQGGAGQDGTSCTVTDNGGGKKTIACGDATVVVNDGAAGQNGAAGTSCVAKVVEGVKTVECTDGSKFTIADGVDGEDGAAGTSCTAKSVDGVNTVECTDGTSFTVLDGAKGDKGDTGDAGTSCAVEDTETGATITCGDVSVLVADGAKGDTGAVGPQGPVGPSAAQVFNLNAETPVSLALSVTGVDVTGAKPVVTFKLINDKTGLGAVGIKSGSSGWIRFGLAQFKAGVDGNADMWSSYVRSTSGAGTTERTGTLVDNGDGTYKYTFAQDIKATTNPVFDGNVTQRLFIQLSGTPAGTGVALPYLNAVYTFVPAGGTVTATHDVASTGACNECHGQLRIHGSRIEVKYCSLCHNADLNDTVNGRTVDLAQMTHAIHAAHMRTTQYMIGDEAFAEATYPQALNFCKKCHDGAVASTPQGGNWAKVPTKEACGACHDAVNFATHMGGQPDNKKCTQCHDEAAITGYHAAENNSPHVTKVIDGAYNFTYEIKAAKLDTDGLPLVTFRILKDGTPLDLATGRTDLTGTPSFLIAYAAPQDGIDAPADWNNRGRPAAQPYSVGITDLAPLQADVAKQLGTLTGPDADGYYEAKLLKFKPTSSTYADLTFPADASMRAVALQGYFTQTGIPDHGNVGRHTVAAYAAVEGEAVRRSVVDSDKCANCHEWFEGHGGNRVRTVEVCTMCHVPNLSSSGRGVDPAVSRTRLDLTGTTAALEAAGFNADDPLTFPEQNQGLKDMLHAAHGAAKRTAPFHFVRDRGTSGVFFYDFSEITFPNEYNTCLSCHKPARTNPTTPATFTTIPEGALWSTQVTQGADASTTALVLASRSSLPNATDLVTSPWAATCSSCHDSALATAHMAQNGAKIAVPRSEIGGIETCALCHGAGREADVTVSHAVK